MSVFRVATYQALSCERPLSHALVELREQAREVAARGARVLVLPECFVGGYFADGAAARAASFSTADSAFRDLCAATKDLDIAVVAGFNERREEAFFNAAAVVENGRCHGVYRKACLLHDHHTPGRDFPVFEKDGVVFGVLICFDVNRIEPARILARAGAKLLLCPMDNRVAPDHPYATRPPYYAHFAARSHENNCWLVTTDVALAPSDTSVCPGHTVVYDNEGMEVTRSTAFAEELRVFDIPRDSLMRDRPARLFAAPDLARIYAASERRS
jgi:predicted amidohydrolase